MTKSTDLPQIESGTDGDLSANESGFAGHLLSTPERDPETGLVWVDWGNGARILEYDKNAYADHLAANDIKAGAPLNKKGWPKEEKQEVIDRARSLGLNGDYAAYTYFCRATHSGRIKIGKSKEPSARANYLQSEQREPIDLLVTLRGGGFERLYLDAFAAHRIEGEWFAPHPDILAEIDRLIAEQSLAIDGGRKTQQEQSND